MLEECATEYFPDSKSDRTHRGCMLQNMLLVNFDAGFMWPYPAFNDASKTKGEHLKAH